MKASISKARLEECHAHLTALRAEAASKTGEAVAALLKLAQGYYAFKQECEGKRGGSVYSKCMYDWFGIKPQTASKWALVGERAPELSVATESLPARLETLVELIHLPAQVLQQHVTPSTTQRQARALKQEQRAVKLAPSINAKYGMPVHEALEIVPEFDVIDPVRYQQFVRSIQARGQIEPITVHEGVLLDGRARLLACRQLGIEPRVVQYKGDPDKQIDFIASCNLYRASYNEAVLDQVDRAVAQAHVQSEAVLDLAALDKLVSALPKSHQESVRRVMRAYIDLQRDEIEKVAQERTREMREHAQSLIREYEAKVAEQGERERRAFKHLDGGISHVMTEKEYKLVIGCLHPDRAPEDRKEQYAEAFAIVKRLEGRRPPLPKSELRARGWSK